MSALIINFLALFFGWLAAWCGYILGRSAEELSVLIVNQILGISK